MFFKDEFAEILSKINDSYSTMTEFANTAKLDRTYISKYINKKLSNPPTPKILEKIANASKGITSYEQLMRICGYFGNIRGDRLKSCRLSRNLSLSEVANTVGISTRKLSLWENGHDYNMDIETTEKLAKLYSVDFNWLFGGSNKQYYPHNNFRMASYNGMDIDTDGLDENDIEEINRFVEFIRNKKKNEIKKD